MRAWNADTQKMLLAVVASSARWVGGVVFVDFLPGAAELPATRANAALSNLRARGLIRRASPTSVGEWCELSPSGVQLALTLGLGHQLPAEMLARVIPVLAGGEG